MFVFFRRSYSVPSRRACALSGRYQPLGDGYGGVHDAEEEHEPERGVRLREDVQAQHLPQLHLHGPATRLRADPRKTPRRRLR